MLGPLGFQEILIILGIALIIFGPRRLPEMGRTLGRALGEFRRATTDLKRSVQFEMDAEDDRQRREKQGQEAVAKVLPEATTAGPVPPREQIPAASEVAVEVADAASDDAMANAEAPAKSSE